MSRRSLWATAIVAALTLSAALVALPHRPERLHISFTPAPTTASTSTTTTEPPPVTTTTLEPAAPAPTPVEHAPVKSTDWPSSLQPCGGDLPPCYVKQRESGGNYNARNNESAGAACGAWQLILSTYRAVMLRMGNEALLDQYPDACAAPPQLQDAVARDLWALGAGCGHWSACDG